MSKLRCLIIAAVLAVSTFLVATPAHAAVFRLPAACSPGTGGLSLNAAAWYEPIYSGAFNHWRRFDSLIQGGTGGRSNVNIAVFDNGRAVYVHNDNADNKRSGIWYEHTPPVDVVTTAANREQASFVAVFDTRGTDPRCTANTAAI